MFLTPEKSNTSLNMALVKSTFLEKLGRFDRAQFIKSADFVNVEFNKETSFKHAAFNENVVFLCSMI
jgi:hypothetical protein